MIETRLVHVGTGTVIERREGDRLAELDRLKVRHEDVLHGICDALHEGYPTEPILRGLLKDTEHEEHVKDLTLGPKLRDFSSYEKAPKANPPLLDKGRYIKGLWDSLRGLPFDYINAGHGYGRGREDGRKMIYYLERNL